MATVLVMDSVLKEKLEIDIDEDDILKMVDYSDDDWYIDEVGDIVASLDNEGSFIKIYLYQLILGLQNSTIVNFMNFNRFDFRKSNLSIPC